MHTCLLLLSSGHSVLVNGDREQITGMCKAAFSGENDLQGWAEFVMKGGEIFRVKPIEVIAMIEDPAEVMSGGRLIS